MFIFVFLAFSYDDHRFDGGLKCYRKHQTEILGREFYFIAEQKRTDERGSTEMLILSVTSR